MLVLVFRVNWVDDRRVAKPEYRTRAYRHAKVEMRGAPCWMCGRPSDSVDHYPPISAFPPGRWRGIFRPACLDCQRDQGRRVALEGYRGVRSPLPSRAW